MMSEKQLIFDFCDWLGCQGCAYEMIAYGDDDDLKQIIDKYFEENGDGI